MTYVCTFGPQAQLAIYVGLFLLGLAVGICAQRNRADRAEQRGRRQGYHDAILDRTRHRLHANDAGGAAARTLPRPRTDRDADDYADSWAW